jgi:hypothetical protein
MTTWEELEKEAVKAKKMTVDLFNMFKIIGFSMVSYVKTIIRKNRLHVIRYLKKKRLTLKC